MKRIFCFILSLIVTLSLSVSMSVQLFAADMNARNIVIFQVDGTDVTMTKGTEKEFKAKAGLKLFEGYTVSTGSASNVYLKLDDATIVKVDQNSKVAVSKVSASKLSLTTISGAVSVDAAPQKSGDSLEVRAGNSALAVRGTIFIVENRDGEANYVMLAGGGDVNGIRLDPGYMMNVLDRQFSYTESAIDFHKLSDFSLTTTLEHADELVALGVFTPTQIQEAAAIYKADTNLETNANDSSASSNNGENDNNPGSNHPTEPSDNPILSVNGAAYDGTVDDFGMVTPNISEEDMEQIIKTAKENGHTAGFEVKGVEVSGLVLPASVIDRFVSEKISAEILLANGAVELNKQVLTSIQKTYPEQDIKVSIATAHLSDVQKTMIGEARMKYAKDIFLTAVDGSAVEFNGKITVHLPYELLSDEQASYVSASYLPENGEPVDMNGHYTTVPFKSVEFTTDHLSTYCVTYDEDIQAALDDAVAQWKSAYQLVDDWDWGDWHHEHGSSAESTYWWRLADVWNQLNHAETLADIDAALANLDQAKKDYEAGKSKPPVKGTTQAALMGSVDFSAVTAYQVTIQDGDIDDSTITGDSLTPENTYEYGESFTAPAISTADETKTFGGWQGSDGETYVEGDSVTVTEDLTLTAIWDTTEAEPAETEESVEAPETPETPETEAPEIPETPEL